MHNAVNKTWGPNGINDVPPRCIVQFCFMYILDSHFVRSNLEITLLGWLTEMNYYIFPKELFINLIT